MAGAAHMLDNLAVCSWSLRPRNTGALVSMMQSVGLAKVQLALNEHRGSTGGQAIGERLEAAGIRIVSGMFAPAGEDYSTLESIRQTGGVVPDETWEANLAAARETAAAARALELPLVTFHAGFLPEDPAAPSHRKLLDRLRTLAGLFGEAGAELALETGQEEAPALLSFLEELALPGLGVNFDPANMILYGKGDPVQGLRLLLPHLKQVHIKDAIPSAVPGTWGAETPVGRGHVDWPAFLGVLAEAGYDGPLCIEREAGHNRLADIRAAARHLESLLRNSQQSP